MKTSLTVLACLGLFAPGCILVADDGGDPPTRDDGGNDTDGVTDDGDDAATDEDDGDSSDDGGTTGAQTGGDDAGAGEELECLEQTLLDPGFEAGSPSEAWAEASEMFDSPLCDASCTEDEGAGASVGEWYAWFGGVDEAERASLTQSFTVQADRATLSLQVAINAASGTGEDILRVRVDEDEVFAISDADIEDFADYTEVQIDLAEWADGETHTLAIEAELAGGSGVTSFFVDEVALIGCNEVASEDETGGEETGADDTGGETAGESDDDTGDDTGGEETTGSTGAEDAGSSDGSGSGSGA